MDRKAHNGFRDLPEYVASPLIERSQVPGGMSGGMKSDKRSGVRSSRDRIAPEREARSVIGDTTATRRGCCIKPFRKSCCAITEMAARATGCDDLRAGALRVTDGPISEPTLRNDPAASPGDVVQQPPSQAGASAGSLETSPSVRERRSCRAPRVHFAGKKGPRLVAVGRDHANPVLGGVSLVAGGRLLDAASRLCLHSG